MQTKDQTVTLYGAHYQSSPTTWTLIGKWVETFEEAKMQAREWSRETLKPGTKYDDVPAVKVRNIEATRR